MSPASKEPKTSRPTPDWLGGEDFLPWSWAVERIVAERNYWIVSVRKDGRPQARPVWGVWFDDKLYLSIGHGGLQRAAGGPKGPFDVSVHVDSAVDVVIIEGTAARVTKAKDPGKKAYDAYNAKYDWDMWAGGLNFVVRPRVAYGWKAEDVKTATKWAFIE
jgi:hypothetical protein